MLVVQASFPARNGPAALLTEELNFAPVIASCREIWWENAEYLRESGFIKCCLFWGVFLEKVFQAVTDNIVLPFLQN